MNLQYILELIGVGFFSISGALAANEKSKPDWFGVTIIGFVTSLGGGSTRDVLLGSYPLVWVKDVNFVYAIFVGIVLASILYKPLMKIRKAFFLFDTLGIAMFTILGTEKALTFGIHPLIAAIMGMFSAVMGGVLRDVLTNETPILFRKEIYATACLSGAFIYLGLEFLSIPRTVNILASILFILLIRLLAIKFNITLPKFRQDALVNGN
jgi:uncharacterized membrane protein YeiH